MSEPLARMRVWLLAGLHLAAFLIVTGQGPYGGPSLWFSAVVGLFAGQVSLTALWVVLGSEFLVLRVMGGLLVLAAISWATGYAEHGRGWDVFWMLYALFAFAGLTTGIPFVVLRARGCRLSLPVAQSAPREALQFSIRDLGVWTLAAALCLGVFRWASSLTPGPPGEVRNMIWGWVWIVLTFGGSFAAVGLVAAWAALGSRFAPLRVVACCVVATVSGLAPWFLIGPGFRADLYAMITIAQGVVVVASLLVVRAFGYQLLRAEPRVGEPRDHSLPLAL